MTNLDQQQHHSRVEHIFIAIANWVNRYRDTLIAKNELGRCGPNEVMQIARDLGISTTELTAMVRKGPDGANSLRKMLAALQVDQKAIADSEPGTMRDLQKLCIVCAEKKRCARELADGTASEHFHEFCPNAFTLDALLTQMGRAH
ncbi:MAG TPA: hypothetical protein VGF02_01120 [Pseudolabrys sp.]|jgi:hypothetical protein